MNNKLRKHINNLSDINKLRTLHNFHNNEECVILACGPSINKYIQEIGAIDDRIIIAIKQSAQIAPYVNYHLLNFVNSTPYTYEAPKPIILETVRGKNKSKADIKFPFTHSKPLASTKQFAKYLMNNNFKRPWGPGIMYEMGFYLAYHLGCRKVTTYGWDNDLSGQSHFNKKIKINSMMIREAEQAKKGEKEILSFFREKGMEINIKR